MSAYSGYPATSTPGVATNGTAFPVSGPWSVGDRFVLGEREAAVRNGGVDDEGVAAGRSILTQGERYCVKQVSIAPGQATVAELHHHRSEHWTIVSGSAWVRLGDCEELVTENGSIRIPAGELHAVSNPGRIPVSMIIVEVGTYLGDDDTLCEASLADTVTS